MQHQNAIAQAKRLLYFRGSEQDGQPLLSKLIAELIDFPLSTNVYASSRIVQDQHFWLGGQPFGEDYLLLITAAQLNHPLVDATGGDVQPPHVTSGGAPISEFINQPQPVD